MRRGEFLLPAGSALVVLALCAVVFTIWQLRSDAIDEAKRDIANLALVLAEQTGRSVQAIDLVLRELQDDFAKLDIDTPQTFTRTLETETIHRLLKDRLARLSQADAITLINAEGRLVNSSRPWPVPAIDLSDRDYYQHFRAENDGSAYISAPVQNRATGTWTVYIVRRINSAEGRFVGMILGAVQIKYFADIYRSIELPRQESFLLLRRDGTVLVRHHDPVPRAGQIIPAYSPWHALVAKGGGHYVSPGYFDGKTRMVAVRPLRDYPLVVNAGVMEKAVLAPWREQALLIGTTALVFLFFALYLMRKVHVQVLRLRNSEVSLTRQNQELAQLSQQLAAGRKELASKSDELETTLHTMNQGLMLVDANGLVVICNKRAMDLLDLPPDLMALRPRYLDVLKYQWETNLSGRDERSFEDFIVARTVLDRPYSKELRRANGRIIELHSMPRPGGGAVRTFTDITERKAAEERIRYFAHHDDLTRLVNRVVFQERLAEAVALAAGSRRGLAVLYLDLDHFKQVNDTRGHDVGDQVLAEAAKRMRAAVRTADTVARIGGDEFAVILPFLDEPEDATRLAQRLVVMLGESFMVDAGAITLGVSIGIALFPQDGTSADELVRRADRALYDAKRAGRSTYRVHQHGPAH